MRLPWMWGALPYPAEGRAALKGRGQAALKGRSTREGGRPKGTEEPRRGWPDMYIRCGEKGARVARPFRAVCSRRFRAAGAGLKRRDTREGG